MKEYSVNRYANAIDTVSSELNHYGLSENNLYNVSDTAFIDSILVNPEFQKKNDKGNRMYSAALKYYRRYIEQFNDKEFLDELLKDDIEYEKDIIKHIMNEDRKSDIVDKVQKKPDYRTVNNQKIWSRNSKYAFDAVASVNYLCEFNIQHQYFISKFNQKNYVEAHHLIPMKYQEQFNCSLDIHANIVSLCLVCHKKIHFGLFKYKKEVLDKLFNNRRERLIVSGIDIEVVEIYSFYQD